MIRLLLPRAASDVSRLARLASFMSLVCRIAPALLLAAGAACAGSSVPRPEDSAKAAHLLLFFRYVTWPDSAFPSKAAPLCACVLDEDALVPVLAEAFKDGRAQGRPLSVRRLAEPKEARGCQIAYLGARGHRREDWREHLGSRPVLTVAHGNVEGMTVSFVMDGSRLRYEVDLAAAERSGLRIAAPMLISARKVRPPAGSPGEEAR